MKTEKASKPVKAMNPEPLQNLIDGVFRDADELIEFKTEQHQRDLSYDPVQQLEEECWKEYEFYRGFDIVPFWDFTDKINILNAAFDAFDRREPENERFQEARREFVGLLQHLGFYRTFIEQKKDQSQSNLKRVEMVNLEHNSTIRKVKK